MPASLAVRADVMRTGTAGGGAAARGAVAPAAAAAGATAAAAVGAAPAARSAGAQPPTRTPTAPSKPARRATVLDMTLPLGRCRSVSGRGHGVAHLTSIAVPVVVAPAGWPPRSIGERAAAPLPDHPHALARDKHPPS